MMGEFLQHRSDKLSRGAAICQPTRRRETARREKKSKSEENGEHKGKVVKNKKLRRKIFTKGNTENIGNIYFVIFFRQEIPLHNDTRKEEGVDMV